uniref:Uncharacterized protein n=1 Tax=Cacopsylla melanoneura TaxID=428564 RepID=A0A8D8Z416_9HEMI
MVLLLLLPPESQSTTKCYRIFSTFFMKFLNGTPVIITTESQSPNKCYRIFSTFFMKFLNGTPVIISRITINKQVLQNLFYVFHEVFEWYTPVIITTGITINNQVLQGVPSSCLLSYHVPRILYIIYLVRTFLEDVPDYRRAP